jgi:hypothetical protein
MGSKDLAEPEFTNPSTRNRLQTRIDRAAHSEFDRAAPYGTFRARPDRSATYVSWSVFRDSRHSNFDPYVARRGKFC